MAGNLPRACRGCRLETAEGSPPGSCPGGEHKQRDYSPSNCSAMHTFAPTPATKASVLTQGTAKV